MRFFLFIYVFNIFFFFFLQIMEKPAQRLSKKKIKGISKKSDLLSQTLKKIDLNELKTLLNKLDFIECGIKEAELQQMDHESSDTDEDEKTSKSYKWTQIFKEQSLDLQIKKITKNMPYGFLLMFNNKFFIYIFFVCLSFFSLKSPQYEPC